MNKFITAIIASGILFANAFAGEKNWFSLYSERHYGGSHVTGITYSTHADPQTHDVQPYGKIGLKIGSIMRETPYVAPDGSVEETDTFVALDGAVGLMAGRTFFAYGELGIDLGEMIWDSIVESDHPNTIDFFAAAGVGIQFEYFKLNVYGKYQWINGMYMEDHHGEYVGTEIAFSF